MSLLVIPIFLVAVFALPFLMARLEPTKKTPTHRGASRRTSSR